MGQSKADYPESKAKLNHNLQFASLILDIIVMLSRGNRINWQKPLPNHNSLVTLVHAKARTRTKVEVRDSYTIAVSDRALDHSPIMAGLQYCKVPCHCQTKVQSTAL